MTTPMKKTVDKSKSKNATFSHVTEATRAVLDMSDAERIRHIYEDVLIVHAHLAPILNEIRWMVEEPRLSRARGLLVTADNGAGKSSIVRLLQNRYPIATPNCSGDEPGPQVLAISVSGAWSTKAVLSRILKCTHSPISKSKSISEFEQLVIALLRRMNVRLLVLDEIQDILNARSSDQIRVLETVKMLMNEVGVNVLAMGTRKAQSPFISDPHLAARFEHVHMSNWTEGDALAQFLSIYEQHLPLKRSSNLESPTTQKLLIKRSNGALDCMLKIIRGAAIQAIAKGGERVTKSLLEESSLKPCISFLDKHEAGNDVGVVT